MSRPIRIAVASGKGGTGKTTIATSLALAMAEQGERVAYVDCDVEEPNGHIFLKPAILRTCAVSMLVPEVDETRCSFCGACGEACRFSAIVALPKKVLTFPKLCHGCGGCALECPENAIREVPRTTGVVEVGVSEQTAFLQGKLNVGEAMAPPVIRAVLEAAPKDHTLVLDAPPGTSCPVIESVRTADVVLLVTEPTPFGLNDLRLAVEMVRELGLPFGVAVNRAGIGNRDVYEYLAAEWIPLLLEIPNDREIARAYSRGALATTALPRLRPLLLELGEKLRKLAAEGPRPIVRPRPTASRSSARLEHPIPETQQLGRRSGVHELVVVSGKGGTGKTSIAASFFALAEQAAVADCDVDAADLHLVLNPDVHRYWPFSGGSTAIIDQEQCVACGMCAEHCRFEAIVVDAHGPAPIYEVDAIGCEGCGVCVGVCPVEAVDLAPSISGEWFVSHTRHGPMVHARLGIAQENSGKLVSLVRREAKEVSVSHQRKLVICDGAPGIGCPVIASITGADMVLVVTESTLSGLHDLKRVAELTRQFGIETVACINKADINPAISDQIEEEAAALGIPVLGRIRYDESVTAAQVNRMTAVDDEESPAATDIRALWERVKHTWDAADGLHPCGQVRTVTIG